MQSADKKKVEVLSNQKKLFYVRSCLRPFHVPKERHPLLDDALYIFVEGKIFY